jgi:ferredoxin
MLQTDNSIPRNHAGFPVIDNITNNREFSATCRVLALPYSKFISKEEACMTETNSKLSRRKFMFVSSAAVASPLILKAAGAIAASTPKEAGTPEQKAGEQKTLKAGKVYFITRGCVGCQTCRTFCPAKAIHFGDTGNEIDQKKCLHCGTCYRECPISVITETSL